MSCREVLLRKACVVARRNQFWATLVLIKSAGGLFSRQPLRRCHTLLDLNVVQAFRDISKKLCHIRLAEHLDLSHYLWCGGGLRKELRADANSRSRKIC